MLRYKMNWKGEHIAIAVLVVALVYYVSKHRSLLNDLIRVPDNGNGPLKVLKDKHRCHYIWGWKAAFACF